MPLTEVPTEGAPRRRLEQRSVGRVSDRNGALFPATGRNETTAESESTTIASDIVCSRRFNRRDTRLSLQIPVGKRNRREAIEVMPSLINQILNFMADSPSFRHKVENFATKNENLQ